RRLRRPDNLSGEISCGSANPSTLKSAADGSQTIRSGSHRLPRNPAVCPAGVTLSLSRITSGSQTDVYAGSRSLGFSILMTDPRYGQSFGLIIRDCWPLYL